MKTMANDELMRLAQRVEALALSCDLYVPGATTIAADIRALAQRAPQNGAVPEGWTEDRLRAEAKARGWYIREGTSVPTADGNWRHPFEITIPSRDLCALLAAAPAPEAAKCACGLSTCVEPWEPGCGLGNSEEFVVAAPEAERAEGEAMAPFQTRVAPWMAECFGAAIASDVRERGDRLLEEVLELLQSHGYDPGRVATLRDYVYGRPVGEPGQEAGGVMVTLAAYCLATGIDMHAAGETELARIWTKVDVIRAKQSSKRDIHSPLPTDPAPPPAGQTEAVEALASQVATTHDRDINGVVSWTFEAHDLAEFARRLASAQAESVSGHDLNRLSAKWRNEAGDWDVGSTRAALNRCADQLEAFASAQRAGKDGEA